MGLRTEVERQLQALQAGGAFPATLVASDPQGIELRAEVTNVDAMSCALAVLELQVPALQGAAFDVVKTWAQALSSRITYLLESIGPIEFDPASGQALIRSTPPDQLPDGTQYYEIMLSSGSSGSFRLTRQRSVKGQPGRQQVDMVLTHEVFLKLVDDLVGTIPGTP